MSEDECFIWSSLCNSNICDLPVACESIYHFLMREYERVIQWPNHLCLPFTGAGKIIILENFPLQSLHHRRALVCVWLKPLRESFHGHFLFLRNGWSFLKHTHKHKTELALWASALHELISSCQACMFVAACGPSLSTLPFLGAPASANWLSQLSL